MPPGGTTNVRVSAPFMHAFRQAFKERDTRQAHDIRDEDGERVIAGRTASARAAVSVPVLRGEVFRDVENLLNTTNLNSTQRLGEFDHVDRSILNYGIPDVAHRTIDSGGLEEINDEIATALKVFEPRIAARSIHVRRDPAVDSADLRVRFLISAEIDMDPLNVPIEFMADIVADGGKFLLIQT